jgi:polar amino acid transport system substrate-binding protein
MFRIWLLVLVMLSGVVPVKASEVIRIGLHLSAPWSFYNQAGELDGIEYQLVSRIFNRAGYQVEYELHSYSRLLKQFGDHKLDCASPVAVPVEGASYTKAYLPFQDVAISLRDAKLAIETLDDLAGKRIVAYQQAEHVLGADFSAVVAKANYIELAERELQLELLFSDRVDVVVGEQRVLHYLAEKVAPQLTLTTHNLFTEKSYPAACWQTSLVDVFNQGLLQLDQNGELAQLLRQYHYGTALARE